MSDSLGTAAETAKLKAAEARAELAATLDAIEDKLNVPKRVGEWGRKAAAAYRKQPLPWIIGGIATGVVAVGAIVVAARRR
jgi:hypothetical protein